MIVYGILFGGMHPSADLTACLFILTALVMLISCCYMSLDLFKFLIANILQFTVQLLNFFNELKEIINKFPFTALDFDYNGEEQLEVSLTEDKGQVFMELNQVSKLVLIDIGPSPVSRAGLRRCGAQLGTISVGPGSQSACTKICTCMYSTSVE